MKKHIKQNEITYVLRGEQYYPLLELPEQKVIFEKQQDCWNEYVSLAEAAIFEYSFKLGARLAIEIQSDSEE